MELTSSGHVEWYTPRPYTDSVRAVFGGSIFLDPASSELANNHPEHGVGARYYFAHEDDGLTRSWYRHDVVFDRAELPEKSTVFLNPPYGRRFGKRGPYNMVLWTRRLVEAYEMGEVDEAILLVNAFTGAKWFLPLWKYLVCLTDHRIAFVDGRTMQPQPDPKHFNAFVYLGRQRDAFADVFGQWGTMVERFQQRSYHFIVAPPAVAGDGFGTVNGRRQPQA